MISEGFGQRGKFTSLSSWFHGLTYAEYDLVLPHPKDPRWFVESVVAWGRNDAIKSEAKLLPALGE